MPASRSSETGEFTAPPDFSTVRLFGTTSFFRLWLAQVASSLGDWVGLVAVIALAARVGGSSPEAAVGLVLSARLVPGFFLGPVAGVIVDRLNRKHVMVACDVGRGLVLASLPFVEHIPGLIVASFLLEVLTQLWAPAKEASVPNLVPRSMLTTANSLSLVAAYGTFPVGSAVFAALAGVARALGGSETLAFLEVDQERLAIWFDVGTFFLSAALISTLSLPATRDRKVTRAVNLGAAVTELREGLRFIGQSPLVRSVFLAIATGLVGGGMLVPLGPPFASQVLGGGSAAFGLLLTALGSGLAAGIVAVSVAQRSLPAHGTFVAAVLGAGACTIAGASMSTLIPALVFVAGLGVCAGAVYVLGLTLLQTSVEDDLRGRIFASFYTLVRFCLLLAFTLGPFLASALDTLSTRLFEGSVTLGGTTVVLPGARLTLWLAGLIILAAGAVAAVTLRERVPAT